MPADQPLSPIRRTRSPGDRRVDVRLLWNEYDGRVVVAVRALEVFDHPFAYAAERGIETSDLELELMLDAPLAG
jgi:hypothetical protein